MDNIGMWALLFVAIIVVAAILNRVVPSPGDDEPWPHEWPGED